jgi:hypothetical protein
LGGLGFHDLELFNLALLARQAWRILNDEESLSARILKAVYFPDRSLLEAELGSHPSQIWRAILDGKEVLLQGIIRRIGNGETTRIWDHNLIPRDSFKRPICSLVQNPPQLVADLIDTTAAAWREDMVMSIFIRFDAEEILKIPVCLRRINDFWAWHENPRGLFTVASAYIMLVRTKSSRENYIDQREDSSNAMSQSKEWSSIWKAPVPPKVRMFLWRLAWHSIPSAEVLHRRNLSTSTACVLCGQRDTWKHALLHCPMSRSTWALSSEVILDQLSIIQEDGAKKWLFTMQ